MRFIKKLSLADNFFAPHYFAIHTNSFRRLSAEKKMIEGIAYNQWQFSSKRIPLGCALVPASQPDHMLVISLEKTEKALNAHFKLVRFLEVNETTVDKLTPGQSLYVTFESLDNNLKKFGK